MAITSLVAKRSFLIVAWSAALVWIPCGCCLGWCERGGGRIASGWLEMRNEPIFFGRNPLMVGRGLGVWELDLGSSWYCCRDSLSQVDAGECEVVVGDGCSKLSGGGDAREDAARVFPNWASSWAVLDVGLFVGFRIGWLRAQKAFRAALSSCWDDRCWATCFGLPKARLHKGGGACGLAVDGLPSWAIWDSNWTVGCFWLEWGSRAHSTI
ncbi:hypothetical protein RchiOBHm_Chr3g0467591 [Rosa chinensis]|uniref:Uncharacterized protein n=1 Tax=Rosa chinensis TaxID=74649 RepID=A0A2P6RAB0_ROSCH|nr:hypothetical protein RchiOBHm_Chr3g0467591 [Rosa chinensis]